MVKVCNEIIFKSPIRALLIVLVDRVNRYVFRHCRIQRLSKKKGKKMKNYIFGILIKLMDFSVDVYHLLASDRTMISRLILYF